MNTNTAKFLFEGISADVVRYLVERNDMDLQEAISTFHNSETFVKLEDFSTGLYIERSFYSSIHPTISCESGLVVEPIEATHLPFSSIRNL